MKLKTALLGALLLVAGCAKEAALATGTQAVTAARPIAATAQSAGQVVHIVSFKFAPSVTPEQIDHVNAEFKKLQTLTVDPATGRRLIKSLQYGTNNSRENLNKGFSHGFVLTFDSIADRDYYVGADHSKPFDPAHDRFKALVGPLLNNGAEGVFVIDFTNGMAQ